MDNDNFEDKIFVRGHLTDFEKLLFANKEIEELKRERTVLSIENGQLKSQIQELEAEIVKKNKMDKEERAKLRADEYNIAILNENRNLRERNRKLMIDNSRLVVKIYGNEKQK